MSGRRTIPAALAATFVLATTTPVVSLDFIRGDVAQDGVLDITDSIAIFGYLFTGAREPLCLSSADGNDDGEVDISDGIYLLQFLFLGGRPPPNPFPACGPDRTPDALTCREFSSCTSCIEAAQEMIPVWQRQGLDPLTIERLFQIAIAECLGPEVDSDIAKMVGVANVDFARLARSMLAGDLDPGRYLQRVRDRARKLRLARADRTWARDCARGDDDGDLVPNSRDRCPDTPDLEPTTDDGCPTREDPPEAPSGREIRLAASRIGFVFDKECDGAPPPDGPATMKFGYNNVDRRTFNIAVSPVRNQPEGCHVFYEVDVRMWMGGVGAGLPPVSYAHMVFQEDEDTDPNPDRIVFRTRPTDQGGRFLLWDRRSNYTYATWRVRAVNGNGLASAWSPYATVSAPSFGEP